ncbi:hypothetical protein BHE74_00020247 [Ensete ventricosum]|nr:hypothetical protein BHE74_00020247 [Ensete ventricosum]
MVKHPGESSKMGQAEPLLQAAVSGRQRDSEQDEREVVYSPRAEEAPSGVPIGNKSHKERLIIAETHLDILETSLEELYQGQRRLLGVKSSQEEAESWIGRIESLVDQLTEDTKDLVQHLHEVVAELTTKVTLLTRTLNAEENSTRAAPLPSFRTPELHCYGHARDAKELENFLFDMEQYFHAMRLDLEETKLCSCYPIAISAAYTIPRQFPQLLLTLPLPSPTKSQIHQSAAVP